MAKYIRGIDVAAWEPNINWQKVRAQEIRFAFIKASQADFTDRLFDSHWAGAKQAGVLRGAYHFLDPRVDSRIQAETFLSKVKLESGDLPPVLDLEELKETATTSAPTKSGKVGSKSQKDAKGSKGIKQNPAGGTTGVPNSQFIACAQDWLTRVETATGRKPIIYSGPSFLQSRMSVNGKPPAWSNKYTLWLANYLNHEINEDVDLPLQPNGWSKWMFWQFSDRSILDGIMSNDGASTGVDLNFYRGTLAELYTLAGATMPDGTVVDVPKVDVLQKVEQGEVVVVADKPMPAKPEPQSTITKHLIKSGDTLFAIALKYHTTVEAIVAANPQITNPNLIRDGDTINIPQV